MATGLEASKCDKNALGEALSSIDTVTVCKGKIVPNKGDLIFSSFSSFFCSALHQSLHHDLT
jgi:hypothetical protein